MDKYSVYVYWPLPDVSDEVLGAVNRVWPKEDEGFCSTPEDGGVQLSFEVLAESYEAAASVGVGRVRVLEEVLPGWPTKVTVADEDGMFVHDIPGA